MPRRSSTFELPLPPRDRRVHAYRWLYTALRDSILQGRLHPGSRLPSTRDLAIQYEVSRGTVVLAFEELKSEGYLESITGSGTRVSRVLPEDLLHAHSQAARYSTSKPPSAADLRRNTGGAAPPKQRHLSAFARRAAPFEHYEKRVSRPFRPNLPALDLFPADLWARTTVRRVRKASVQDLFFCDPMGFMPLRLAVAEYLTTSRGVNCQPEQIAIVSGVQEALDLTARLLAGPGDRVGVEDPGYPGAALAFEAVGAHLVPLEVDDGGWKLDWRRLKDVRLLYVTPGHQFPLGITMSLPRRLQVLEWATRTGATIFEDDYDSEYRYEGRPVPALQSLDSEGAVLFAGSFSKVLFPSLRMGYAVIPADLVDRFAAAKSISTRHAPMLEQMILSDFMEAGHFARHLRRMRQIYSERRAALVETAKTHWSGLLEISGVEAGLQTAARLCEGMDPEAAAMAAAERGIEVVPINRYSRQRKASSALQLGFAPFAPREIRHGVRELALALEPLRKITHNNRSAAFSRR
ncbi:PLP-dependent aminotransferase family protein [Acidobacteria bacterium AB60]|nr:PLP-dependent aminotransferase family protein [Acidobacteria bacterium AB60]